MNLHQWYGAAAAVAVVATATLAGHADVASTASWGFSEVAPDQAVPADESFGSIPLYAAGNTTLRTVAHDGGVQPVGVDDTALDYNTWRGLAPGQSVDSTAEMLSTDPGFETDRYGGSDGGSNTFDPGTGDFSVSVWVQPTPAAQFPLGSLKPNQVSPNIVQKGRATAAGGYWKLYLQLANQGGSLVWVPVCVLKGGNGQMAEANDPGRKGVPLTPGVGYTLTCSRTAGAMSLTIAPDGGNPVVVAGDTGATMSVSNSEAVSVGHKPKTTDPTDVYDGLLDSLTISAG